MEKPTKIKIMKSIKKFGNSYCIRISPDEMRILNLKENSIIQAEIEKIQ